MAEEETGELQAIAEEETGKLQAMAEEETGKLQAMAEEKTGELQAKAEEETGELQAMAEEKTGELQAKLEETGELQAMAEEKTGELQAKIEEETGELQAKAEEETGELQAKPEEETGELQAITEEETGELQAMAEEETGELPNTEQEDGEEHFEIEGEEDGEKYEELEMEEVEGEQEPTAAELEALFNKNTASFRCLAQILISRSSLLRHPFYNFPPLEDPGIDKAFNYEEPPEVIDNICAEKYKRLCKELKIMPISRIVNSLPTDTLNLKFYGVTNKQIKALTNALQHNAYVQELLLEENFLTPESVYELSEMLQENNTLKVLNLKECNLGPEGAANLNEGILTTQSLRELDLSHNSLRPEGIKLLKTGLQGNGTIYKLNLSHNELDEPAASQLAEILKENSSIEDLDLSWNTLCTPAALKTLCFNGLMGNTHLKSLNLAWNGIANPLAVKSLAKYLRQTNTLEFLDLSNNRFTDIPFKMIRGAIRNSPTLLGINLGFNPMTPDEALSLVKLLTLPENKRPQLEILDLDNVYVKREFLPVWRTATKLGKNVKIGGVLSNYKIEGPNISRVLFDRARMLAKKPKKKKKRRDFSHFIFALPDKPMKRNEFQDLLKKFGLKMIDKDLVEGIANNFKKKKWVDVVKMRETYLELYPDAQPAPPKKKKKKKKKRKGKKKKRGKVSVQGILDAKVTEVSKVAEEVKIKEAESDVRQVLEEIQAKAEEIIMGEGHEGGDESERQPGDYVGKGEQATGEDKENKEDINVGDGDKEQSVI